MINLALYQNIKILEKWYIVEESNKHVTKRSYMWPNWPSECLMYIVTVNRLLTIDIPYLNRVTGASSDCQGLFGN